MSSYVVVLRYSESVIRRSFTIVELLISVSIMAILASASLFALYGVMEDAKEMRTRAQIARLNELILDRWDQYQSRPVPVVVSPTANPRAAAQARLAGLRELMRMELPDRKSDVIDGAVTLKQPNAPATPLRVSRWRTYQRRARAMVEAQLAPTPLPSPWHSAWTEQFESSECLYLIVASIQDGETNGVSYFRESEIGDLDGDGMPELLDGWGKPLAFLRWAPGFLEYSDIQVKDSDRAPDPFDPLKVDPRWSDDGDPTNDPFALYPLIYSSGRDGSFDIAADYDPPGPDTYFRQSVALPYPNDPYHTANLVLGNGFGEPGPGSADNITNHLLGGN